MRDGKVPPGSDAAVAHFLECFDTTRPLKRTGELPRPVRPFDGSDARQKRQLHQLIDFTQRLLEASAHIRDKKWAKFDRSNPDAVAKSARNVP